MKLPALLFAVLGLVAGGRAYASSPEPTAELVNTYWKLLSVGAESVVVAELQREPYLLLQAKGLRVTGFGGCNRLVGSYTLEGRSISFSRLAGTLMACMKGMGTEQAFHACLARTAGWRIHGEKLELLDASGQPLAQFESRYMK